MTAANQLTLVSGTSQILDAMMRDLTHAHRRVWIESYIVRDDHLGSLLARELGAARLRRADVRLLFDALGSKRTSSRFIDTIRESGVLAEPYRPLRPFLVDLFPRDHARIVLLDDVAYVGGSAWGDEWLPKCDGGEGWHDVCVRLEGPCIADLERIFQQRWLHRATSDAAPPESAIEQHADTTIVADLAQGARRIYEAHVEAVRRAKTRIWLENAYFFPPTRLLTELIAAATRGVDVRVVVPGKTDRRWLHRAGRGEYARWLSGGLSIFEYRGTMMHAKIGVVDDSWCTVGTFNINPVSMSCTNELNVFVRSPRFVSTVAAQILHDAEQSEPVTLSGLARWPRHVRLAHGLVARGFRALEHLLERERPRMLWRQTPSSIVRQFPNPRSSPPR